MGERVIGIIGGMGSEATLELFKRILLYTDASRDQDHFRTIVDCNPKIADRTAAIVGSGEDPVPLLIETARNVEQAWPISSSCPATPRMRGWRRYGARCPFPS